MLSFENTPYLVTENSRVNPYTTPDRSPISMYYDFDNDNDSDERVDQRKEPLTVKKKQFVRKPTGIEKDRNSRSGGGSSGGMGIVNGMINNITNGIA